MVSDELEKEPKLDTVCMACIKREIVEKNMARVDNKLTISPCTKFVGN